MWPLPAQRTAFPSQDKFLLASKAAPHPTPHRHSMATSPCSGNIFHNRPAPWEDMGCAGQGGRERAANCHKARLYLVLCDVHVTALHSRPFTEHPQEHRPVDLKQRKERRHKLPLQNPQAGKCILSAYTVTCELRTSNMP